MRDDTAARLIREVRRPLLAAVERLSDSAAEIHSQWRRFLAQLPVSREGLEFLSRLDLTANARRLRAAGAQRLRESAEEYGQELASRGVTAACTAAAVTLYVEACLPYLLADGQPERLKWAGAVARFASAYQFLLLSGYARQRALERQRLEEKFGRAEQRLQGFSADLGEAYERERRRLARDLHDEVGHDLIVLKLYMEMLALDLKKGNIGPLHRKIQEVVSLVKHALSTVRRLTFDLGPAVWSEQGFLPAFRLYARQFSRRTAIKVRVNARRLRAKLPSGSETALYKVLQGALANVAAHASARNVTVTLASEQDSVLMRIEDDGKGFNVEQTLRAPESAFGLRAMRERIELLGGTVEIFSRRKRRRGRPGTAIEVRLPLRGVKAA
jgi:signal transduction histidine kinase